MALTREPQHAPDGPDHRRVEAATSGREGRTSSRSRRVLLWAVLLLSATETVLFWGALARGETFAERDLRSYYRPAKSLIEPLWRTSRGLPLWNPLFSSGQPFAANPEHEVFHPLTALFLILPFEGAFRAQVLIPPLVGGLAAHLLARTLRRSPEAAALAAVAWGFGGYLLSTTNLLPILFAASILPAVLAFLIRSARLGRARDLAGLAFSVALAGLAGEPSTLLMLPLLAAAAFAHDRVAPRRSGRVAVLRPLLGVALGIGLSAAALVPGLHHASKTVRANGFTREAAGRWSFPPVRVLELLSPRVMGHVEDADEAWYWGGPSYPDAGFPFLYSIYPGLGVALLAVVGATRGARRLWPWLTTAAFGLLLATGTNGPLWNHVRGLPVLSGLRYPEKFILLVALPLLVISLEGFDRVFGPGRWRRRSLVGLHASVLGLALVVAATILHADGGSPRPWTALGVAPHLEAVFASVAARDALRTALVAAGALTVLVLLRDRRLAALAFVAVTAADLGHAGRSLVPTTPVDRVAAPPPFLRPLLESRPRGPIFHAAAEDPVRGKARGAANPPIPAQWGLAMTLERDFDETFLETTEKARRFFWEAVRRRPERTSALLERRGVSAVVKLRAGAEVVGGVLRPPPGGVDPLEVAFAARPPALVFAAERVVRIGRPEEWPEAVLAAGGDVSRTVFLATPDAREAPAAPSDADVTILDVRPGRLVFDVLAHGPFPSLLAVNQTWDEGWSARRNGDPARILLADVSLSALAVPPGRHRVELVYGDPWIRGGLVVSALSLVALAATAGVLRYRRGRNRRHGAADEGPGAAPYGTVRLRART